MSQKENIEALGSVLNDIIQNTEFNSLTASEKVILLSNLLLVSIKDELPTELKKYGDSFLSNGKEIALKVNENMQDVSLQVALKAHLLIDLAHKL